MPGAILGLLLCGNTMRMTRTMMLEVLRQDYIRTAWSKGLRERVVVSRHALKNAFIPVITLIGLEIPVLVGGTIIIEQIFALPGIGLLTLGRALQTGLHCGIGVEPDGRRIHPHYQPTRRPDLRVVRSQGQV